MAAKFISLSEAASIVGADEPEILELAADGKIALCAHSPSWAASRGKLVSNGQFEATADGAVVLHDTWLFVNPPYLRSLIDADEPVEMGLWRSVADGAVDLFIARPNKPRIRRRQLHLRAEDLKTVKAALGAPDSDAGRSTSDIERKLADMVKTHFDPQWKAEQKWPPSKVTREFIRDRYDKNRRPGDTGLSENAVVRIDAMARPPEVKARYSKPNSGRKPAAR